MDGNSGAQLLQGNRNSRHHRHRWQNPHLRSSGNRTAPPVDEVLAHKLHIGNLDPRVTEYHLLKLFAPLGKIRREEFAWHTHGPRRGEPRGFAFVEYSQREEAESARAQMNGRLLFGRPLVVRFVEEKVVAHNAEAPMWAGGGAAAAPADGALRPAAPSGAEQQLPGAAEADAGARGGGAGATGAGLAGNAPQEGPGGRERGRGLSDVGKRRAAAGGQKDSRAAVIRQKLRQMAQEDAQAQRGGREGRTGEQIEESLLRR